jgi:hypothetical protein
MRSLKGTMDKHYYCVLKAKHSDTVFRAVSSGPDEPKAVQKMRESLIDLMGKNELHIEAESIFDYEVTKCEEVVGVHFLEGADKAWAVRSENNLILDINQTFDLRQWTPKQQEELGRLILVLNSINKGFDGKQKPTE